MADSWIPALVGLLGLVVGLGLVVLGWSFPVTTCMSVQGMEPSCSTSFVDSVTGIVLFTGGIVGVVLGGRRLLNVC
jgi:hypothetical protein